MAKQNKTLENILAGDTIASLAAQLDVGDTDAKIIVVLVAPEGVRIAKVKTLSKAEALGALYMAIELQNYEA